MAGFVIRICIIRAVVYIDRANLIKVSELIYLPVDSVLCYLRAFCFLGNENSIC